MARYEHLSIYKAAFDFNVYVEKIVRNFSRYHKYTLGTELRDGARRVAHVIFTANNTPVPERLPILLDLRAELAHLTLTLRLCKEVKAFHSLNSFETAARQVVDISRQNEGWIASLSRQSPEAGQGQNSGSPRA